MLVLDTSTLLLLAKSDLLRALAARTALVIPRQVEEEALVKPELDDARTVAHFLHQGRVRSHEVSGAHSRRLQHEFGLGVGEAAALWLAKHKGVPVGTDDRPAMRAAKLLGVPFFTTLHVLGRLCETGRLDQRLALAKLERLERFGRYSAQILAEAREGLSRARR